MILSFQYLVCGFFSNNTSMPFASIVKLLLFHTVSDNSHKKGNNLTSLTYNQCKKILPGLVNTKPGSFSDTEREVQLTF